jgi:hypothetical protein
MVEVQTRYLATSDIEVSPLTTIKFTPSSVRQA